jgi:predicted nucleic-acid-binding protein
MIALDTNVVIRYLTQDDKKQSLIANKVFEKTLTPNKQGFISLVVLTEIVWVLEACYDVNKPNIINIINSLTSSKNLIVEQSHIVRIATTLFTDKNADFSDALIFSIDNHAGCEKTLTFDKKAASIGMTKL